LTAMQNETRNRLASFDNAIQIKRNQIKELSLPGSGAKQVPSSIQQIGSNVTTGQGGQYMLPKGGKMVPVSKKTYDEYQALYGAK
jgi:hypothetical protein